MDLNRKLYLLVQKTILETEILRSFWTSREFRKANKGSAGPMGSRFLSRKLRWLMATERKGHMAIMAQHEAVMRELEKSNPLKSACPRVGIRNMYRKTYKDLVRKQVIFESLIARRLLASTCYRASILTSRLYSEALNKRIGRINTSLLHLECRAFSAEYNFILKEQREN